MKEKTKRSGTNEENQNSVPVLTPGIGTRIKLVSDMLGGNAAAGRAVFKSDVQIGRYIREESTPGIDVIVALAKAAGVSLEWLATGEGPMFPKHASDEEKAKIDAEIEAVEKELSRFDLPVSQEDILRSPELFDIKQRVIQIRKNPAATDPQRARADLILSLAFQDEDAEVRVEQKKRDLSERLRAARESYEEVIKAVGYQPPPAFAEALKTAIFVYGLNVEGATLLLEAFKHEVSKT